MLTNLYDQKKEPSNSPTVQFQIKAVKSKKILVNKKNWVGKDKFMCRGRVHNISEIMSIQDLSSSFTFNFFLTTYYSIAEINLSNGENLRYKAKSGFIRTDKLNRMSKAIQYIQELTFESRYRRYVEQIQEKGYFDYNGYKFHENGDVSHEREKEIVNIPDSALISPVIFGWENSFGLNSRYTPNVISIYQRPHNKKKDIYFTLHVEENRDVIFAIVPTLAKAKGGEVTSFRP